MANQKKIQLQGFKFKPFSEKQLKLLNWWQDNSPVKDKFMIIADGAIRSGKSQHVDTIIPTPKGMVRWGDLVVGDYVFDRLGRPTKILGVYPQGIKDIYEVTFSDGSSTNCELQHLWSYTTKKCVENGNYTVFTSTLEEIKSDLERLEHVREGKYRFPLNGCVEFEKRDIKIDPYLLGAMLSDNCFLKLNSILSTDDENWLQSLVWYNLYNKSQDSKFVPEDYKINSVEVRLSILGGLLNMNGSVAKDRLYISFCSVSKQLVEDVVFLARSLGMWVNTISEENKHDCYSCCIRVNDMLYEILSDKHKSMLNMDVRNQKKWRTIKSIEYIGKCETQCIYVDNEEHLYLCDDFIVTHNTVSMILSFVLFVMNRFNQQNAAMCGKSVGSFRRNVLVPLKQMLLSMGYDIIEHRSENYVEIIKGETVNYFYIFGAKIFGTPIGNYR